MLLLLFAGVGTASPPPPPPIDTTLQTILTRGDFERYKRRPVFKTLLEEAEHDLKLAYNKLQRVAFNKRPAARKEYEEMKEIVEELRNDNVLRQRIKRLEAEATKAKLKNRERNKKRNEKYPGLLSYELLGPRIFKK